MGRRRCRPRRPRCAIDKVYQDADGAPQSDGASRDGRAVGRRPATLHDATQYVAGVRRDRRQDAGHRRPTSIRVIDPVRRRRFRLQGLDLVARRTGSDGSQSVGPPGEARAFAGRRCSVRSAGGRGPSSASCSARGGMDDSTLVRHDVISHTSFMEDFAEPATQPTRALYACANGATTQRLVQAQRRRADVPARAGRGHRHVRGRMRDG